jgi:hypothetical protein
MNELHDAIAGEIRWHENEARLHLEAAADILSEDSTARDEAWQHEHDAKMHEDAADRLAVILFAHSPAPPPEAEIAF